MVSADCFLPCEGYSGGLTETGRAQADAGMKSAARTGGPAFSYGKVVSVNGSSDEPPCLRVTCPAPVPTTWIPHHTVDLFLETGHEL